MQKQSNGLYKVSLIEFVALPAKAVITAAFNFVKKSDADCKQQSLGSVVNAEGFFGIRKL